MARRRKFSFIASALIAGSVFVGLLLIYNQFQSERILHQRYAESKAKLVQLRNGLDDYARANDGVLPRTLHLGPQLIDPQLIISPVSSRNYFYVSGHRWQDKSPAQILIYDEIRLPSDEIANQFGKEQGCLVLMTDGTITWLSRDELESHGIPIN